MCVGSECTQPPYNDKNPPSGFYLIPKNYSNQAILSFLSVWRHTDEGRSHGCWLTLASYLRPALSQSDRRCFDARAET